ncbi:DUF3000 domain-containing protein [Paeniglutamicibacter cryotolerans]|uniref:DUF3000 domain-containing protein n=1 Tax=Paeniglutamicibacter cryotolerans TaxID=670079 RepID=A0A839QPZ7_9MICC|nr:DUF3000 domain-containing protein [Paeniglutamicibacter cryotolerans]MBB2996715.1 hypothetical protein [Paeniglutamicibacter cryotolerans]
MSSPGSISQVPPEFLAALSAVRRAHCRTEVRLEEIPAPARLAPYALALSADVFERVHRAGGPLRDEEELATGRFVLLHDPAGSDLWDGTFRIVTYIRARMDAEMGNDALLGSVAWTWLVDALDDHRAPRREAGGTATRVLSESFGTLNARQDTIDIELRASWTPEGTDIGAHLAAWVDMVATFAGIPPLPAGVTALPHRRRS